MASDLKAAVVGTGGAGRLHAAAYAAGGATRLVGVVSGEKARAEGLAAEHGGSAAGVRGYASVEEMLRAERPDVVSVATLEWDHEAPVMAALAAGAHVLCEKPMAESLAAGERMQAAARSAGRSLGVNFNYRSVPSHRLIQEELARGGFGRVGLFTAHMHAYLWPHMLDLMRSFFGDPEEVTAAMVDEQALRPPVSGGPRGRPWEFGGAFQRELMYQPSVAVAATFRYGDFVATMSGSALVPLEQNFWSFALYGSDDAVVVDRASRSNLNGTASLGRIAERIAALPACSYEESFALSVAGFVEAVLADKPVPVTGEDGLAQMRLDAAIVKAVSTGRATRITEITEEKREHRD
ncbi:MAG TPA: Gfo/Idh/MocA family oxidoreductase [Acidobacteriaceae bacterium]|jgi:predicted dehydrogenase